MSRRGAAPVLIGVPTWIKLLSRKNGRRLECWASRKFFQHDEHHLLTSAVWTLLPALQFWPLVSLIPSLVDDAEQPTGIKSQTSDLRTLNANVCDNLGIRIGADEFMQLKIARAATRDSTSELLLSACD